MLRFASKKTQDTHPHKALANTKKLAPIGVLVQDIPTNVSKMENDMNTNEKATKIENILQPTNNVKRVKRDKGLIERTESSKIVLTEDNKQLLND